MSIVVDASVAAKWFVAESGSDVAEGLIEQEEALIAPDLLLIETANVLWKAVGRGSIDLTHATTGMAGLSEILVVIASEPLMPAALRLAVETAHPIYDCVYVELARSEGARLATANRRLSAIAATVLGDDAVIRVG